MSVLLALLNDDVRLRGHTSSSHRPALNVIMGEIDILVVVGI